ncbi:MAG: methyltransferase domain-containing protein [Sulfurovum sp.]|nr:methyltransferase domain-containing protein [Sulfurovum sp.]
MAKIKERGKYDYNFDAMAEKFEKSIYGTLKGEWRLKLLKEDMAHLHAAAPMQVWDAGCGLGQMALWFAKAGHSLTCNDISYKMLERAQAHFAKAKCEAVFYKAPAQEVAVTLPQQDLVLFHAVIEWLAKPLETLEVVAGRVKPDGYLSLLFFNQHSLVFRNTLRGGWRLQTILDDKWYGRGSKLTPPHPQTPETIQQWLKTHGFETEVQTAIRVFHDYMSEEALEETETEKLLEMEYRYCRQPTFCNMGRYIHILARRTTA